jgi:hypothetical protein
MKRLPFIIIIFLGACGGSLTDEQRKEMREKMEENKILHVTEVEITEEAFAEGRKTFEMLDSMQSDSAAMRRFLGDHQNIHFITPRQSTSRMLEQQLVDAYLSDPSGAHQDNVQKVRNNQGDFDTLLYTKPVVRKLPDGSDELIGVWNMWLPKKALVVNIGKTK